VSRSTPYHVPLVADVEPIVIGAAVVPSATI
jgi:hypothetical protein